MNVWVNEMKTTRVETKQDDVSPSNTLMMGLSRNFCMCASHPSLHFVLDRETGETSYTVK
jgi:hypothetical protein